MVCLYSIVSAAAHVSVIWSPPSAYQFEVLTWRIDPYNTAKSPIQEAGKATGRLTLIFQDDRGTQGWVAGRFQDALVRYLGDPDFLSKQFISTKIR